MRLMTNTVGVALVTILCLACTGCELLALSLGAPEEIRRAAGAAQCEGIACDPARWVTVNAYTGLTVRGVDPSCYDRYSLDFQVAPPAYQSVSVNLADELRLLIVSGGVAYLVPFGQSAAESSKALQAVAGAWSNAGDRIAVATLDRDTGAAALLILDANLEELERFDVAFAVDGGDNTVAGVQNAFVSWNSSDTLIAVSALVLPQGALIDLDNDIVQPIDVRAMQFIGERSAVATDPGSEVVRAYTIEGSTLRRGRLITAARFAVASDPMTGVFLTLEPLIPGRLAGNELGLRTLDSGPAIVRVADGPFTIIPIDIVRQTMSGLCEP